MEAVVPEYGIHVDRVSLQEARLPVEILNAAAAACATAYQPLVAQRQAAADTPRKLKNAVCFWVAKLVSLEKTLWQKRRFSNTSNLSRSVAADFIQTLGAVFEGLHESKGPSTMEKPSAE